MNKVTTRSACDGVHAGPVEIDADEGCVCTDDRSVALTATEIALLVELANRAGAVVPKWKLMDALGFDSPSGFRDRRVDVHLSRVRAKLADLAPEWTFVHTHVGVGYRFDPVPTVRG